MFELRCSQCFDPLDLITWSATNRLRVNATTSKEMRSLEVGWSAAPYQRIRIRGHSDHGN
jgi:hypothetical protein